MDTRDWMSKIDIAKGNRNCQLCGGKIPKGTKCILFTGYGGSICIDCYLGEVVRVLGSNGLDYLKDEIAERALKSLTGRI